MSDNPFGFQLPDDNEGRGKPGNENAGNAGNEPQQRPTDPMSGPIGGSIFGMPEDLAGKIPLFAELQKLLSWQGGPVNWDLAQQTAISALVGTNVPVSAPERNETVEAVRLADLWLDAVTDLPSATRSIEAWSRIE